MFMRLHIVMRCLLAAAGFAFGQGAPETLNLRQAEQTALKNNPRLAASALNAAAAGERPAQLHSALLPQVTGNLTGAGASEASRIAAGGLNNPLIYDRVATGLTLNQIITDFGRNANLVASAGLQAQAQQQNTEAARAAVILEVDRAYFGLLRAESVLRVARKTVKARQLVVDEVRALARNQQKSTLDVSSVEVNLSEAELLLASAENETKAASATLSAVLGYPDQHSFLLTEEPMPAPLPDDIDSLVEQAWHSRPELANLRLTEVAARHTAKAEDALRYPTITALASIGYTPEHLPNEFLRDHWAAAGINVSLPLFNGGLSSARRTEAELRARATAKDVQDLQNRIARDVRVAYLHAQTAYQRVGLTARMLEQARLALDLAQTRYDSGLSSVVELSRAQLNVTAAEVASAGARYDYQTQRAVLDFETGSNR
jgi:outer membrane protein